MTRNWTAADMPSQQGRRAIVTGTAGIGYETALALSRAGAEVVIAGRSATTGLAAATRIQSLVPGARIAYERLDLSDLDSVARFASAMESRDDHIDLLVNNAVVMAPPTRQTSVNGFEMQLATNFLGHYALTAQLLPLLQQGRRGRVVTPSSVAARSAAINFEDINAEAAYNPMTVYSQSKLACLIFAFELQRRRDAGHWSIDSIAAHPGVSRTILIPASAGRFSLNRIIRTAAPFLFQPAAQGALPVLFAATDPEAEPGGYYGPARLGETRGQPARARKPAAALDEDAAAWIWKTAEQMTGVRFVQVHESGAGHRLTTSA